MTGSAGAQLAAFAGLLADRTRATFCLSLLDGRAWTAGELATAAGVARSTATEHLTTLVDGGLLADERQGRHRYVRLADARAAQIVEELAAYAVPEGDRPTGSMRAVTVAAALRSGRTCYDHLAGRLGVALIEAMADRALVIVDGGVVLTPAGSDWLASLGVDVDGLRRARRPIVRTCLDWTERRAHLAGSAAAALCTELLERDWVRRIGSGRAVRLTDAGSRALGDQLGLAPA